MNVTAAAVDELEGARSYSMQNQYQWLEWQDRISNLPP